MRVIKMYTGDDQRTHFEELDVKDSEQIPVQYMSFGAFDAYDEAEHPAPRRQLVIVLEGTFELGSADGVITLGPGEAFLAEDITGEGHTTRIVGGRAVALPLVEGGVLPLG